MIGWFVYEASKKKGVAVPGSDFSALTQLAIPKKAAGQLPLLAGSGKPARDAAALKKSPTAADRC